MSLLALRACSLRPLASRLRLTAARRAFSAGGNAKVLVLAEHDNKVLNEGTLNAVTAAKKIGADVTVLVAGHSCQSVVQQVR
jgi:hypothetical protein